MVEKSISLEELREKFSGKHAEGDSGVVTSEEASHTGEVGVVNVRLPMPRDSKGRVYATGTRKSSVARVWLKAGKGKIVINGKSSEEYFQRESHRIFLATPFRHGNRSESYDIWCTVKGGGFSGQAGAIRHGISIALQGYDVETRAALKAEGFLTTDARRVERKKPGRKKARKSFQFCKR